MKHCPSCGATLSDQQNTCPSCGGDYLTLSIQSISGDTNMVQIEQPTSASNSSNSNAPMLLDYMENSLETVASLGLPTLRDSFKKMSNGIYNIASVVQLLSGIATENIIFFGLAGLLIGTSVFTSIRKVKKQVQGGKSAAVLAATTNVFEENAKSILLNNKGNEAITKRLEAVQGRLAEIKAVHEKQDKDNRRLIWIITAVCTVVFLAGVSVLAVKNYKTRKAEIEYAQLPTWVKVRDNFIVSEYNDEYGDNTARLYVLTEILNAKEEGEAEKFFFDYCMGNVGDFDCAKLIIEHYRKSNNTAAVEAFAGKLNLRYESDTQKAKKL